MLDSILYLPVLSGLLSSALHSLVATSIEFKGELLAIVAAVCWAAGSSVYKKGLETTDVWSGNLMRIGLASLGFIFVLSVKGNLISCLQALEYSLLFWLVFSAFFALVFGDYLLLTALKEIGVSRTVPISSTYPLFVTVWAFIFFEKHVSGFIIIGTILIVIAIRLISEERKKVQDDIDPAHYKRGILIALSAAILWSVSIVVLDQITIYFPSEFVAGFRFLISALFLSAIVSRTKFTVNKNSLLWIGIGGALLLMISNYAFVEAIRLVGSTRVAPITSVYPVISVFVASAFLGEKLTLKILGGTCLSCIGVMLVILG
ncbi:MAG: DMT family transporter [Theionarchaea archaeon]|nr:DMT family transporter [Theionarchaea archaeon]